MIRRLLIILGAATLAVGGLGLLSGVRQFGYVGSWGSIGLRQGKLWYVWRTSPISDGEGFYVDSASAINRAMHNISGGARFRDRPVGPLVVGALGAVAYALILPPAMRRWKRRPPRWVLGVLVTACLLFTAAWITSRFVTIAYYASRFHFRLADGTASLNTFTDGPSPMGWGPGWTVQRWGVSFINSAGYFSWRGGMLCANLPLAGLLVIVLVPTTVLIGRSRRIPPGHCKRCAYDLTGNVSGVCPECGTWLAGTGQTDKSSGDIP